MEIKLEDVYVTQNFTTIIHVVELDSIMEVIDSLEHNVKHIRTHEEILTAELTKIKSRVQTLFAYRQKRGLFNIMGNGLKWITGSMDDNDRIEIENHFKTLDENNEQIRDSINKEIIINNHYNKTFYKLKTAIEQDRAVILNKLNDIETNNDLMLTKIAYLDTLLKIKLLEENIEHIQNNIASAKLNFMSSNVLTREEIESLNIDFHKLQLIELAVAKYRDRNIIFVLRVPKDIITAKRYLVSPIGNENYTELAFEQEEIVIIDKVRYIFKENSNVNELKRTNICVYSNNCRKKENKNLEIIEIEKGVVLVRNAKNINVSSNCDERQMTILGNYLFTFYDCELNINNMIYTNKNKKYKTNFVMPEDDTNLFNKTNKNVNFDELILDNDVNEWEMREQINFKSLNKDFSTFIGLAALLLIVILNIILFLYQSTQKKKIQENFHSKGGGVTSNSPTNKIPIDWNY